MPVAFYAARYKPDLIFTICPTIFSVPTTLFLSFISKLINRKKVFNWIHYQDLEIEAAFNLNILKGDFLKKIILFLEKIILKRFHVISSISYGMMDKIKAKITDEENLFYFPNFIETKQYEVSYLEKKDNPFSQELNIQKDTKIIMYSGSLNEKLSYQVLIDSIKKLNDYKNILWVISGEGPMKDILIQKLKGIDNVLILPFQSSEKLASWLNIADIHLIPQKISVGNLVLPSKLLGILSSGKPVIGIAKHNSDFGKILDLCGIRVNSEDSKMFKNAILNLLNDQKLQEDLSIKGKKYVKENFEKDIILNKLLIKIKTLID